ncbi:MAG: hypothetical protein U0132_04385 [Gemmatimonadaceae bacterium]
MRFRRRSSSMRFVASMLMWTMNACNESAPVAVEDPNLVPAPKGPVASLSIHGPTWVVVGAYAWYWATTRPALPFPTNWSWLYDAPLRVSSFDGSFLYAQAVFPGTSVVTVTARGADTARKVVTILPRPTAVTPMEQSPIAATSFRLLELRQGLSDVFYAPMVDVAPRADGALWILEATFDLPGVSLEASRCSANRQVGQGGQLFGVSGSYGDESYLVLQADSSSHATGLPVLHLIVMDPSGRVTQVSITGALVDFDSALMPPTRYPDADDLWTCG